MASDLTERLAAKLPHEERAERLSAWGNFIPEFALEVSTWADQLLAFLLSEPELVAGLAPEVKREVLRQLLGERLGAVVNWDGDVRFERYGNAVLVSREEVLKALTTEAR